MHEYALIQLPITFLFLPRLCSKNLHARGPSGTPKTPPCRRVIRAKHPGFRCQNYILEEEISAASSLAEKTQPLDVCRKKMEKLAVYSEARVECKELKL